MKKITIKKAQSGSTVAKSIKISAPIAKSDSLRAKEMSNYKQLRALSKRGSTVAREEAPIDKSTKRQYDTVRNNKRSIASDKNGGKMKKKS